MLRRRGAGCVFRRADFVAFFAISRGPGKESCVIVTQHEEVTKWSFFLTETFVHVWMK
jgi:hypothetical protein